jgi:hypothetical protein
VLPLVDRPEGEPALQVLEPDPQAPLTGGSGTGITVYGNEPE